MSERSKTRWLPQRDELLWMWDVIAAALAVPTAVGLLAGLAPSIAPASSAVLEQLPYAAILAAVAIKLAEIEALPDRRPTLALARLAHHAALVPLLLFWVLFFTDRAHEISPAFLLVLWILMMAGLGVPRMAFHLLRARQAH